MVRGTVTIDRERCKGCQLCISVCPQAVLHLSTQLNSHGYPTITLAEGEQHCTGCALCALVCPDVVFSVYRTARQRPPAAVMA
ncbi:MAG: 4Fe-4S dicluster domain-containing protein [Caldilinea sp. CFX5]|nr:4Fe-4S dicluster domain-containing protein [Caldilinea sp. CFX5]